MHPKSGNTAAGASGQWRRGAARLSRRFAVLIKEVDILGELGLQGHDTPSETAQGLDLSCDGVRLACLHDYPAGSLLKIEIQIPDWERYDEIRVGGTLSYPSPPFSVLATPVWSARAGDGVEMGLRFVSIHDRHRRMLKRLVDLAE